MAAGHQVILLKDLKIEQLCPVTVRTIERFVEKIICLVGKEKKSINSNFLVSIKEQL